MNRPDMDNPIYDIGCEVTELYKMADMAEIITEAIFNGDNVTLQSAGNSMDVFLGQLKAVIANIDQLYVELDNRFSWIHAASGNPDTYYGQEYDAYIEDRREAGKELDEAGLHSGLPAFVKLLPDDQREAISRHMKKAQAGARKRGFIEGYKAAVGKCAGNGGAGNGGT